MVSENLPPLSPRIVSLKVNGHILSGRNHVFLILPPLSVGIDIEGKQTGPQGAVDSASDPRATNPGFDTRSGHTLSFLLRLVQERHMSICQLLAKVWELSTA